MCFAMDTDVVPTQPRDDDDDPQPAPNPPPSDHTLPESNPPSDHPTESDQNQTLVSDLEEEEEDGTNFSIHSTSESPLGDETETLDDEEEEEGEGEGEEEEEGSPLLFLDLDEPEPENEEHSDKGLDDVEVEGDVEMMTWQRPWRDAPWDFYPRWGPRRDPVSRWGRCNSNPYQSQKQWWLRNNENEGSNKAQWWLENNEELNKPEVKPGEVGATLYNLGNTCFLNAILQCLTHTVLLIQGLRTYNHPRPCERDDESFCVFCALHDHIEGAITSSGDTLSPAKIVDNLNYLSADFRKYQQEDAHELLQCMLDRLHSSCITDANDSHENLVSRIFGGRLVSKLRCCNCGHCSDTYEPLNNLSLEIENVDSLPGALESFTKVEKIEEEEPQFICESCKGKVSVEKQLMVDHAPSVAAFHLKRFKHNGTFVQKIDKHVEFPLELDLMSYSSESQNNDVELKYDLYAVVVHSGFSSSSGHYFSFIRASPDAWYRLDDCRVSRVSEDHVLSRDAYIILYAKNGTPWFSTFMESEKPKFNLTISNTSPKSVLDHRDLVSESSTIVEANISSNVSEEDRIDAMEISGLSFKDCGSEDRTDEANDVSEILNMLSPSAVLGDISVMSSTSPESGLVSIDSVSKLSPTHQTNIGADKTKDDTKIEEKSSPPSLDDDNLVISNTTPTALFETDPVFELSPITQTKIGISNLSFKDSGYKGRSYEVKDDPKIERKLSISSLFGDNSNKRYGEVKKRANAQSSSPVRSHSPDIYAQDPPGLVFSAKALPTAREPQRKEKQLPRKRQLEHDRERKAACNYLKHGPCSRRNRELMAFVKSPEVCFNNKKNKVP